MAQNYGLFATTVHPDRTPDLLLSCGERPLAGLPEVIPGGDTVVRARRVDGGRVTVESHWQDGWLDPDCRPRRHRFREPPARPHADVAGELPPRHHAAAADAAPGVPPAFGRRDRFRSLLPLLRRLGSRQEHDDREFRAAAGPLRRHGRHRCLGTGRRGAGGAVPGSLSPGAPGPGALPDRRRVSPASVTGGSARTAGAGARRGHGLGFRAVRRRAGPRPGAITDLVERLCRSIPVYDLHLTRSTRFWELLDRELPRT